VKKTGKIRNFFKELVNTIKQNKASREYSDNNVCDACGQNPKAPDSQICKECQKKAYDD
jgi:hypothetical protein